MIKAKVKLDDDLNEYVNIKLDMKNAKHLYNILEQSSHLFNNRYIKEDDEEFSYELYEKLLNIDQIWAND
jgi:S-adenosylmethionine:tRNA-ribosyltransferase-isomerase (queuine synthetase)